MFVHELICQGEPDSLAIVESMDADNGTVTFRH